MFENKLVINENSFSELVASGSQAALRLFYYLVEEAEKSSARTVSISYLEIENALGMGRSTVCRAIRVLKDCNLIRRGFGSTSEFIIPDTVDICNFTKII